MMSGQPWMPQTDGFLNGKGCAPRRAQARASEPPDSPSWQRVCLALLNDLLSRIRVRRNIDREAPLHVRRRPGEDVVPELRNAVGQLGRVRFPLGVRVAAVVSTGALNIRIPLGCLDSPLARVGDPLVGPRDNAPLANDFGDADLCPRRVFCENLAVGSRTIDGAAVEHTDLLEIVRELVIVGIIALPPVERNRAV